MLPRQTVTGPAERKQLLLAQSEALRLLVQLECQNLRSSFGWLKPVGKAAQVARAHPWVLSAAAGLLVVRRGRSLLRWLARGVEAWRLIRRFF